MTAAPVLVTPPAIPLISLAEAREHLRVDGNDEDTVITGLAEAVTQHLDGWHGILGRCLLPQTWRIVTSAIEDTTLPFPDAIGGTVKYLDATGSEQTWPSSNYTIHNEGHAAVMHLLPTATIPGVYDQWDAVRIEVQYGFQAVPPAIKAAALMLLASWYENREATGPSSLQPMPMAVDALLAPFRAGAYA